MSPAASAVPVPICRFRSISDAGACEHTPEEVVAREENLLGFSGCNSLDRDDEKEEEK
jgi:hypothetical protein